MTLVEPSDNSFCYYSLAVSCLLEHLVFLPCSFLSEAVAIETISLFDLVTITALVDIDKQCKIMGQTFGISNIFTNNYVAIIVELIDISSNLCSNSDNC